MTWPCSNRLIGICSSAGLTGLILSLLAFLGFRAKPGRNGWRRITPGPGHWFVAIFGTEMVLLFVYVRLFVGSARADAESQMRILSWLIIAFSGAVGIVVYEMVRIRRVALEWRGATLLFTGRGGERTARTMDQLVEVRGTPYGWIVLSFADGETVKISQTARGIDELGHAVIERRPDLFPDLEPG